MSKEKLDWQILEGKRVSVLIDGYHDKESYFGILYNKGDWVELCLRNNPHYYLSHIFIRKDQILSVWIYANNLNPS